MVDGKNSSAAYKQDAVDKEKATGHFDTLLVFSVTLVRFLDVQPGAAAMTNYLLYVGSMRPVVGFVGTASGVCCS